MTRLLLRALAWLLIPVIAYWLIALIAYRFVTPALTPLMLIRSIEREQWVWRETLSPAQTPATLLHAVMVAEDSNFCLHPGIDIEAFKVALQDYRDSGRVRGASTISMQVARNLFLWPGGGVVRKVLELPLTLALEALWPKQRIIETYLNIAEWGPGVFGAEAAARHYFGVPARDLQPAQAALLAAVLPNPIQRDAGQPSRYVHERARQIERESRRLSTAQLACIEE